MIVWRPGGRKYPTGAAAESVAMQIRWPSRGTGGAGPVSTLPPPQELSIGLGLDLRGGLA